MFFIAGRQERRDKVCWGIMKMDYRRYAALDTWHEARFTTHSVGITPQ